MALRGIRLVIPTGTSAFKAVNAVQKVRGEHVKTRVFISPSTSQGQAN